MLSFVRSHKAGTGSGPRVLPAAGGRSGAPLRSDPRGGSGARTHVLKGTPSGPGEASAPREQVQMWWQFAGARSESVCRCGRSSGVGLPIDLPISVARTAQHASTRRNPSDYHEQPQRRLSDTRQHGPNGPGPSLKVAARVRIPLGLPTQVLLGAGAGTGPSWVVDFIPRPSGEISGASVRLRDGQGVEPVGQLSVPGFR